MGIGETGAWKNERTKRYVTNAFLFFCDDIKENETSCFFSSLFIYFLPYEFQPFLLGKLTSQVSYLKKMKSRGLGFGVVVRFKRPATTVWEALFCFFFVFFLRCVGEEGGGLSAGQVWYTSQI